MQRWQCPIYNGTLKSLSNKFVSGFKLFISDISYIFSCSIHTGYPWQLIVQDCPQRVLLQRCLYGLSSATHLCPFGKSKFNLYKAQSLTASTLLHRLVQFIELGTVQTGTGKVDPARKFKFTTAGLVLRLIRMFG